MLHRASCRGFTPCYNDLDTLAEKAFFAIAAAKVIASVTCIQ